MEVLYRTSATAHGGGRAGTSALDDGTMSVTLTVPKAMGGDGAPGANPEQLFALGYSGCFLGAVRAMAAKAKVKLADETSVTAHVGFAKRDDGTGFEIDVRLEASLPGIDRAVAEDLVRQAHIVCPYSHAMRTATEIEVKLV